MEKMTTIFNLAMTFFQTVQDLAQLIIVALDSTVGDLFGGLNITGAPAWLQLILDRIGDLLNKLPIIGDATLLELAFGSGVLIIVVFGIVKYFIPTS